MDNIKVASDLLINYIKNMPEIKRIKELETYIDNNQEIKDLMSELKFCQKKYVNAKYYKNKSDTLFYERKIESIKDKMSDVAFVDEYLELLNEAYLMVNNISKIISDEINKEL